MECETCNPEKFYIYGQCPSCKRLCSFPLFDPEKMDLETYLKVCEQWKKEVVKMDWIPIPYNNVEG